MLFFDFSGSLLVGRSIDIDGIISLINQELINRKIESTVTENKITFDNKNYDRISFDLFGIIGSGFIEIKPIDNCYCVFFHIKTGLLFKLFSLILAVPLIFIFLLSKDSFMVNIFIFQYLWLVVGNLIIARFRYKRFLRKLLFK